MGVTTHNPNRLEFPATMTNMQTGTIMMSGCGILTNGKGTKREYGDYNLDELNEGDRVGMMRRPNGSLHFYINGLDQGVAATRIPSPVWGVIDLYGMTMKVTLSMLYHKQHCTIVLQSICAVILCRCAKKIIFLLQLVIQVSIVERDVHEQQNLVTRRNTQYPRYVPDYYNEPLAFHPNCGSQAQIINNGRTARRPNAADDFNKGVVLTNRPLKTGEMFEVRLDRVVTKWAGSIEIGITTHAPTELEFPYTMTNVRSGTWIMSGCGIMHNGTVVIEQYGANLDRLQVGDKVGVVRKENGNLHFFVNGVDQGVAATHIPDGLYGVMGEHHHRSL